MKTRSFLLAAVLGMVWVALVVPTPSAALPMGEVAIFTEQVGWIGAGTATAQGQILADKLKFPKAVVTLSDKDIGPWAEARTNNGQADIIVTFGWFPTTLYPPGNAEPDDSVGELFLEGGNVILNTADYIFYVTQGGGVNGDTGLKNMTDINLDMWGDNTAIEPTEDGEKYTPSLGAFNCNRPFKGNQVVEPWEVEVMFGSNGADFFDPGFIHDTETGGRIGILHQVSNDALPRGDVFAEMIDNYLAEVLGSLAVDPDSKLSATWGHIKSEQ